MADFNAMSQWVREEWALPEVNDIVEAQDGERVRYGGVNWYGVETTRTHLVTHWSPLHAGSKEC